MTDYSQNYYLYCLDTNEETSKIFSSIPMFLKDKDKALVSYLFLVAITSLIEILVGTYLILPIITLLFIVEHRRLIVLRECVMDLCMAEEIFVGLELKESEDYLLEIGDQDHEIIDFDRDCIFSDTLIYSPSRSRSYHIKNHYRFYSLIVAIYVLLIPIKMLGLSF